MKKDYAAAVLSGINLHKARLDGSTFNKARLSRVDLGFASLAGCDFKDAEVTGTSLQGADLRNSDLSDAKFRGVTMETAKLSGSCAVSADFSGVNLRSALMAGINAQGADFSGSDLSDADLSSADLSGADLSGADLTGANVKNVDFSKAKVAGALFFYATGLSKNEAAAIEANSGLVYTGFDRKIKGLRRAIANNRLAQAALVILALAFAWSVIAYFSDPRHRSSEAVQRMAEGEYARGHLNKAVALYELLTERVIREKTNDPFPQLRISSFYRLSGQPNKSLEVLYKLLKWPDFNGKVIACIYTEIAHGYQAIGKFEEARRAFQLSIASDPGDADLAYQARLNIGETLRQEGKRQEALGLYESLLNECGGSGKKAAELYTDIGQVYRELDNLPEARKAFSLSIEKDPGNRELIYWSKIALAEMLRQENRPSEALKIYEKLLADYKDSAGSTTNTYGHIAQTYLEMGRLDEAKKAFLLSIQKDPRDHERVYWSTLGLAEIKRRQGEPAEAIKIYEKLMAEYGDNQDKVSIARDNIAQARRE